MAGTLFVATQYVAKPIAILPHRVVEGHDRPARDAEHDLDILAHERLAHHLCSGTLVCHELTPAVGLYLSRVE